MKRILKWSSIWGCVILLAAAQYALAQRTDVPPAEFDVIIKTNGEIVYGRVVEVNLSNIRYKRTDIPDGPVYEILRKDVFVISYRNQLKEVITAVDSTVFAPRPATPLSTEEVEIEPQQDEYAWQAHVGSGEVRLGIGLIRNFSRIKEVDSYKSESGTPGFHLTYVFPYRNNLMLGVAVGWARFNYSDRAFSEYDQILTDRKIKETLTSVAVVGKYNFDVNTITPYVMGGLAFNSSNVNSDGNVTFVEDGRSIRVQSGARSGGLGILFRAGFDVAINEKYAGYADIGNGLTLLQVGGVIKLGSR